jgi:hypothetical protein
MAVDMTDQIIEIVDVKVCRLINAKGRAMTAQAQ